MKTIAEEAQEFLAQCYPNQLEDRVQALDCRMIFYSGFTSCLACLCGLNGKTQEEISAAILGYTQEAQAFSIEYAREHGEEL